MTEEKTQPPTFASMLASLEKAPSPAQIETWKTEFGEVFIAAFSEKDLCVFRPVSRHEWKDLQTILQTKQMDQLGYEELLVSKCLLYPEASAYLLQKAGTVSTLAEQIMQASNFIPTNVAVTLVQRL